MCVDHQPSSVPPSSERAVQILRIALAEQLRLGALVTDVSVVLTGSDALQKMLQHCAEAIVSHLDAAFARIWTLNVEMLELQASAGIYTHLDGTHGRIPIGERKIGHIAKTRQPHLTNIVIDDPYIHDQEWARREGMVAFAGYPLLVEDRLVGVMALFARQPLSEAALQTIASVANEIALGIGHKRVENERNQLLASEQAARAEAEAQANQLEVMFETMVDGLVLYDCTGKVVHLNRAGRKLVAISPDSDYTKQSLHERVSRVAMRDGHGQPLPENEWPQVRVLRGEVLIGTEAVDITIRTLDGTERLLSISGAPMHDTRGKIIGAVCLLRDVTKQRRLEQRTYDALDALLSMAHIIVQGHHHIKEIQEQTEHSSHIAVQPVARQLAELTRQVLGCQRMLITTIEPETDLLHPLTIVGLSPRQEREFWARQQREKQHLSESFDPSRIACLSANEVLLLDMTEPPWNSRPNRNKSNLVLVAPICIDKRLMGLLILDYGGANHHYTNQEEAMAQGVAELVGLVIERERLIQERAEAHAQTLVLHEASERMDAFLSMASHELRTPLATIKGNIQLAKRRLRNCLRDLLAACDAGEVHDVLHNKLEDVQMMLNRAERQVNVQNRLVGDLLDISRIQAGRLQLQMAPCDLPAIVRETVEDQRTVSPARTIHLEVEDTIGADEKKLSAIIADAERIGQVISNYLTNAIKYSPEDRPIEIRLKKEGEKARLSVRDGGMGLSPEEQVQVWERFYRVPGVKSYDSSVGLGLGLHICRTIIEQHQGEVGVESTKGAGSTFWFTLPLAGQKQQVSLG